MDDSTLQTEHPLEVEEAVLTVVSPEEALEGLEMFHSGHLMRMAQLEQELVGLLGDRYPLYKELQSRIESENETYRKGVEDYRKDFLQPAVLNGDRPVYGQFFRVTLQPGRINVAHKDLLDWAVQAQVVEQVERFVTTGKPYIKVDAIQPKKKR
jgi:hypothetical protein